MAKIVVELSDNMKGMLEEYKRKEGFRTTSEAIRSILREYFKKVGVYNGAE